MRIELRKAEYTARLRVVSRSLATEPFQLVGKPPIERFDTDVSLASYTEGHLGFHGFMRVVDARIGHWAMVGVIELPDRNWRDLYDEETDLIEAADEALAEEGFGG